MPSPSGSGSNGVLLVGEALGGQEVEEGLPFAGRAGQKLASLLRSKGWDKDEFLIDTTLRCQPPQNKLLGRPDAAAAIRHCSSHVDGTIATSMPKVIVAMGAVAMRRILDLPEWETLESRRGYVEWSRKYHCWVIATFHPSFLMRGNQHLSTVFLDDLGKAVRIAQEGFSYATYHLTVDPPLLSLEKWVRAFEEECGRNPNLLLAADIETPYKADEDEGGLVMDDPSYQILRVGFSYNKGSALSIPWNTQTIPFVKRLLGTRCVKVWWNARYDVPRLLANGISLEGSQWDAMLGWHVLNSDLPKGLGFVVPLLCPDHPRWKHLGKGEPGKYNALDAVVTLRCAQEIFPDLLSQNLWHVFDRHVIQLDTVLDAMSTFGVPVDQTARVELSQTLQTQLKEVDTLLQEAAPVEVRRLHPKEGFAKPPKHTDGMIKKISVAKGKCCPSCGEVRPSKKHQVECNAAPQIYTFKEERWFKVLPFTPSNLQMRAYLAFKGHHPQWAKGTVGGPKRMTFDNMALKVLQGKHPDDPLYPLVRRYRDVEKTLSTYVGVWNGSSWEGGIPVGADGKVHTTYVHNPSTLRLASQSPNMQNIPSDAAKGVRRLFCAEPGRMLVEIDYRAIEAVVLGYLAGDADIIRLAKLGIHDFLNCHILHRLKKVDALPDLKWSDADLSAFFKALKKKFPNERNVAKRVVHGGNYGMSPIRMNQLYPEYFTTVKLAASLKALYFEVLPGIPKWQTATVNQAAEEGFLRNPFGYRHRFWTAKEWKPGPNGTWYEEWGEDAKKALAFGPQSTAAGVIKEAMLRLAAKGFVDVENQWLRLQVHDSLLFSFPSGRVEELTHVAEREMTLPIPELGGLVIDVESVRGLRWEK